MTVALLLYMGHIPRIFAKNLLYSQKTRFRVPKGDKGEKKKMWKETTTILFSFKSSGKVFGNKLLSVKRYLLLPVQKM